MRQKRKWEPDFGRFWLRAVALLVSAGLVALLVSRIQKEEALRLLATMDKSWLLAAFAAACLIPVFATLRWLGIIRAVDKTRLPFTTAMSLVMTANLLNLFLPSKGGDLVKALHFKDPAVKAGMVGTILVERIIDLGVLGLFETMAGLVLGIPWAWAVGGCLVLGCLTVLAGLRWAEHRRLPWLIPRFVAGIVESNTAQFSAWSRRPGLVLLTLAGAGGNWLLSGVIIGCLVAGIHGEPAWLFTFAVMPPAVMAGLVPLTISGIGTRDAAFTELLSGVLPLAESTLVALGYTFFVYWVLALIGLPCCFGRIAAFLRKKP